MGVLSQTFRDRLRGRGPLLLDAAMGTELQRRDLDTSLPLWSAAALLRDPELVWTIHTDEVAAGAQILTANTFRTHARSLGKAGLSERSSDLTVLAVRLARQAAAAPGREIFVAGSLSPLEDCYRPDLVPEDAVLAREHGAQARFLAEAGVDLILAETHNTIREAVAALRAAKETGVPVVVSLVCDGEGRLLSGEPVAEAARALLPLEPDALGVNCVPAPRLEGDL
ncbi:MAG: homocysteine S-methyltransferase family protein, partial [Thermoanaerobaculia bacterium]